MFPDDGVLHRNMYELFNVNFNANLILFFKTIILCISW